VSEAKNIWGLRLLAVALAILAWFFFNQETREHLSDKVVEASLRYPNFPSLVILNRVEKVRVGVRGPESEISGLNPFLVDVFVDLANPQVGSFEVLLGFEDVSLPGDLEVVSIEPQVIAVRLDRRIDHILRVTPRLEGEPAAGAVAKEPEVFPAMVHVRGPQSRIDATTSLSTTPIDLTGHALDFEVQAVVLSPDPLVTVVQPVVTVRIPMEIPSTRPESPETPPAASPPTGAETSDGADQAPEDTPADG
jgi:YbbR domain-containing protein